jgi:hypothetical protein
MTSPFRFVMTFALLVGMPVASHAQFPQIGPIGPSGAQVAGAIAGVAGVTSLILYLALRKPTVVGCVHPADGSSSLTDEKDKRSYVLVGDPLNLKAGERVKLKGKKIRNKDGSFRFRVKKVDKNYGACNQ